MVSDMEFLSEGTVRQREAYRTLSHLKVFDLLAKYDPTLTGTIPVNLDINTSDLDVVCEAYDLDTFEREVARCYGDFPGFETHRTESMEKPASVTNFETDRFPVQVFAQPAP